MADLKFPIYCKDGICHLYMIIAHDKVMAITNSVMEVGVAITHYHGTDHHIFDDWKRKELLESNSKDFHFALIEVNNHLLRRSKSE